MLTSISWLAKIYNLLLGGISEKLTDGANPNQALAVDSHGSLQANIRDAAGADQVGASGTGISQPTGGSGILGWLSGIFNKLNTSIAVTGMILPREPAATMPADIAAYYHIAA
jgi:hypothetical protein